MDMETQRNEKAKYLEQLIRKLEVDNRNEGLRQNNQSEDHDSLAKLESIRENEDKFADAEEIIKLICENSKVTGYYFLVFISRNTNSSTFTEIVKSHAKNF